MVQRRKIENSKRNDSKMPVPLKSLQNGFFGIWDLGFGFFKKFYATKSRSFATRAYLIIALTLVGCGGPEPRRPVEVKSGSFFTESVERSKQRLAKEERQMRAIMEKDTAHEYEHSATGSWYRYNVVNPEAKSTAQPDDLVTLTYNMIGFDGDTLYTKEEIGVLTYKVDKQDLFPGLRNSVKLLKEGETATFLHPSSLAYGYHGDDEKIGVNVPVMSTLTILKIERDSLP